MVDHDRSFLTEIYWFQYFNHSYSLDQQDNSNEMDEIDMSADDEKKEKTKRSRLDNNSKLLASPGLTSPDKTQRWELRFAELEEYKR